MKWSSIKNVLILLLAATNVFLLANILIYESEAERLPKGLSESAVRFLEGSGITASESLMPEMYEKRRKVSAVVYGIDDLSEKLLGERVGYKSIGRIISAEKESNRLTLSGDEFAFETGKEAAERDGKKIISALKEKGFDMKYAFFDKSDGFVKNRVGGAVVTKMYLNVCLDESGEIASIYGTWGELSVSKESEKVSFISALPNVTAVMPEGSRIDKIVRVYIPEKNGQKYEVKPGWRIISGEEEYTVG